VWVPGLILGCPWSFDYGNVTLGGDDLLSHLEISLPAELMCGSDAWDVVEIVANIESLAIGSTRCNAQLEG
jgi:hypothetical protein